jgi:stearoyl-CoA desaturase (delta-9 desaturase)
MASTTRRRTSSPAEKLDLAGSIPFFTIHLLALGVFFVPFHWSYLAVALGLYVVRMFGITAGYHRYFSHRAYKTSRWFQFVLAFLATTSAQKGVLWWAAHHRHHHKYSDTPEDVHSPKQQGLWWAHVGWILSTKYNETHFDRIKDFAKYPELRWLNKYHLVPPLLLAGALWLIGGLPLVLWGFVFSTVLLWHGTFTINSLTHIFGKARYASKDESKNHWLLALITLGEGWHNNHHFYQSTANQGWFWWEVDVSYYTLKVLSWLGIVWDLRTPPEHIKYAHKNPPVADTASKPASAAVAPVAARTSLSA